MTSTKKPTDLKSVSLEQIDALEARNVVGGGSDAGMPSTESKRAKDQAKLSQDARVGEGKEPVGGKDKSDTAAKIAKDMNKVVRDTGSAPGKG